ncbi:hypothetical protein Cgig2_003865 [Carnegiea gigantea]|uniref:Uncharacterized protein n=1 Tax=Carnegiea gigantea TaxID=171969 RepID=A0A9Q1K3R3_9CARY|nr:hypothetical protein Cgig2_003865 [Carnegiea gigantea]
MSDHLPILLRCSPHEDEQRNRKRRLHFENMWFTDPLCKDAVISAWASVSKPNVVDNMICRIEKCSEKLSHYNKSSFGHVGQQIKMLEHKLKTQHDGLSRCQTLGLIREWRKKEEILWWQRVRSDYLKYDDFNARWFHSRANMRRAKNMIVGLTDSNGVWQTNEEQLNQAKTLKEVLYKYELASGQMINCSTTDVVFSKGVPESYWNQISL